VEGHRILVRNLNKVFYPAEGYKKRDILEYYDAVAELLIPHWKDRPLSLRRYPDGITKEGFFQKNAAETKFPAWLRTETVMAEDGKKRLQVIGDGRAALLYLANLGCIDQNPWMSRLGSLDNPDFLLIDLDPYECGFDKIVEAALYLHRKLELLNLQGYPKTTGGDGMHIYVPLEPVYTYQQTRAFAEILARLAASEQPNLFTLPRVVGQREKGKVYFDYLQNARGKTISAPYVLRAYPGAPVATPLAWSEVRAGLDPKQFHIRNALARFAATGDLFAPVLKRLQRLEPALERLEQIARTPANRSRGTEQ
jgi:bifunctional non-homologous end joining protein LigD